MNKITTSPHNPGFILGSIGWIVFGAIFFLVVAVGIILNFFGAITAVCINIYDFFTQEARKKQTQNKKWHQEELESLLKKLNTRGPLFLTYQEMSLFLSLKKDRLIVKKQSGRYESWLLESS